VQERSVVTPIIAIIYRYIIYYFSFSSKNRKNEGRVCVLKESEFYVPRSHLDTGPLALR
jgi:hypothetical protein